VASRLTSDGAANRASAIRFAWMGSMNSQSAGSSAARGAAALVLAAANELRSMASAPLAPHASLLLLAAEAASEWGEVTSLRASRSPTLAWLSLQLGAAAAPPSRDERSSAAQAALWETLSDVARRRSSDSLQFLGDSEIPRLWASILRVDAHVAALDAARSPPSPLTLAWPPGSASALRNQLASLSAACAREALRRGSGLLGEASVGACLAASARVLIPGGQDSAGAFAELHAAVVEAAAARPIPAVAPSLASSAATATKQQVASLSSHAPVKDVRRESKIDNKGAVPASEGGSLSAAAVAFSRS
jgi:hypothetical protein